MIDLNELNNDPWTTYPVSKDELRKTIARLALLENALVFYADKYNWYVPVFDESRVIIDGGRIARLALTGEDHE